MSKSLGNAIRIRDALNKYTAAELRYYFASFHYREQVKISDFALKRASNRLKSMRKNFNAFQNTPAIARSSRETKLAALIRKAESDFRKYMDDDFDTPRALAVLTSLSERLSRLGRARLIISNSSVTETETCIWNLSAWICSRASTPLRVG